MRYVDLFSGASDPGAKVSVLGFGCAAVMGRTGKQASLKALSAASDAGITFFDTARSYGYGESETLLGEFFRGRRHEVVLCTKFGILPPAKSGWKQKVKPLAQAAVRLFPALRAVARRQAADESLKGQFSVAVLHQSLETSLRELQTDFVDMLLLHAAPPGILAQDELFEALERLVASGKVRRAGISGELPLISEVFTHRPAALTTAQFALNRSNLAFTRETASPAALEMFLVGNHPFGGPDGVAATIDRIARMRVSEHLSLELRAKLEPADDQLMPEIVLNGILDGTGVAAVVPAMMNPVNLRRNVRAVESCRFTSQELSLLREELIREP